MKREISNGMFNQVIGALTLLQLVVRLIQVDMLVLSVLVLCFSKNVMATLVLLLLKNFKTSLGTEFHG